MSAPHCFSLTYSRRHLYTINLATPSFIHSFIHSFIRPFLKRPFKSSATQRRSRLQHGYCIGVSRRSAQATAGKGLAKGPYVAARAGFEPTTLRTKGDASTNEPPRPTHFDGALHVVIFVKNK